MALKKVDFAPGFNKQSVASALPGQWVDGDFVLSKAYNATESWTIFDNRRNGFNPDNDILLPDSSDAEGDENNTGIDLLSNGFNPYYGTGTINRSGKSYIYMVFCRESFCNFNRNTSDCKVVNNDK